MKEYLSEQWGDSLMYFVDMALQYDSQLAEAYDLKGNYYNFTAGDTDKAFAC